MNLFFLDSIEQETFGGMEEWIRLIAAGMARRGHAVTVAGRKNSEFLRRLESGAPGVKLLPMKISGDFNPATIAGIKRHLEEREADLICVNFNKDIRLGGLAARLEGKTRVVWSVGLDITKDNLVHKLLTPRLVDGVVVPSESLKQQVTRLGYIDPKEVEVIPIGIPDRPESVRNTRAAKELRRKYNLSSDSMVAVTVGRLVEQKGHVHLVEAAAEITRRCPEVRLLLLGDGPLEETLKEKIADRHLGEQFVFAGMLDNIDLELAGADLMVHPSVWEPYGIAVLEGMRSGLPIVASRVGGIPEVVGEGEAALLVASGDSDDLAKGVVSLIEDKEARGKLAERARARYLAHFEESQMLDRVERYFRTVIETERIHGKA